jgi:hypothetical protein
MGADRRPCEREDLECYLLQSVAFTVNDSGYAEDHVDTCDYENTEVDEYTCRNCGAYWKVEDRFDRASVKQAGEAALAHIGVREAAA